MKVYLATDHAGLDLKEAVKKYLIEQSITVEDCGAYGFTPDDDYPDFVSKAANKVRVEPESFGIIFGGTGQGEAMVANKFKNIRCALFYAPAVPHSATDINGSDASTDPYEMLRVTRKHNNSNMLALSGRFLKPEEAIEAVKIFLNTQFSSEERHNRRIGKITMIEDMMGTIE